MYVNNIGGLIRQLRQENKLSLEELAFDVGCDVRTLSRIENNKCEPKSRVYEALMQKFGINPKEHYDIWIMAKDYDMYCSISKLNNLLNQKKYDEAEELVNLLENGKKASDALYRQFILCAKARVARSKKQESDVILNILAEAINITLYPFSEKMIDKYRLSNDEIIIIDMMGIIYSEKGDYERAINIFSSLKLSIENSYVDESEKAKAYILAAYNLTKCLGLVGKHEEVIDVCEDAIKLCLRQNKEHLLPNLYVNYACALFHLGDKSKSSELFGIAYVMFVGTRRFKEANQTKEYVKKEFNIDIFEHNTSYQ